MSRSSDAVLKALGVYLKAKIPELTILDSFPDPKHQFVFPTLSIIGEGQRGYNHVQPEIFKTIPVDANPELFDVVYTVGDFNYKMQLDLWCEYKSHRGRLFDEIHDALNDQFLNGDSPCGLSLALPDYYDLIARIDQVGYTYLDSEESSQRSEWRVKIEVNVSHSKLSVKRESKMLDIQIHHEISDDTDTEIDNELNEEITEI